MQFATYAVAIATIGLSLAGCAPTTPAASSQSIAELAGRTAGQPRRCVPANRTEALRLGNPQTLLYGTGRTIWVNRLTSSCGGLSRSYTLVVEPIGTQYCRGDRVRTIDPVSKVRGAACLLGDFVPYSR